MKCLGIACSPRPNGNSQILLEKALAGAKQAGAETELVLLNQYQIKPCLACDYCSQDGQCRQTDQAAALFEQILAADRVILAAPIFSMGINAKTKILIDRSQKFWACHYVLHRPIRPDRNLTPKGLFIATAGTKYKTVFDGAWQTVRYFFKMLELEICLPQFFSGVDGKGEILQDPQALKTAWLAGSQLALP